MHVFPDGACVDGFAVHDVLLVGVADNAILVSVLAKDLRHGYASNDEDQVTFDSRLGYCTDPLEFCSADVSVNDSVIAQGRLCRRYQRRQFPARQLDFLQHFSVFRKASFLNPEPPVVSNSHAPW